MNARTTDFPYIRAYCSYSGSLDYYLQGQLASARKEKAPWNAVFKTSDGIWRTVDDIVLSTTQDVLYRIVERHNWRQV